MKILLDTDCCIDILRGHPRVSARAAEASPDEIVVSTISRYELMVGVQKCSAPGRERDKVELLLSQLHELPFTRAAAHEAARIRATLESAGSMIGPYDVLLAGQAMAAGLKLVTANVDEFSRVVGLQCEDWR